MNGAAPNGWALLEAELDAWGAAGRVAQIWWRDDDAGTATPVLERLIDLAAATAAPLALAVIPQKADAALARLLENHRAETAVLQHGYAHVNHAAADAKKCELVSPTQHPAIIGELAQGRENLSRLFGGRFHPVLVPPWNRIADDLVARLPRLGFAGLSTYKPRTAVAPAPHLVQVNCHLDILQWRPERKFLGTEAALALLTGHLAAKRQGEIDTAEPSGILSHHQAHDAAAWDFLAGLLTRLGHHPAAQLLAPAQVFAGQTLQKAAP